MPMRQRPLGFERRSLEDMRQRARSLYEEMSGRRSVRSFSPDPVPKDLIEWAIRTAVTAPSGAHRQPWRFVAVSDPELKRGIRAAAEKEEYQTYHGRMSDEWRSALEPLGTTWEKPFLETAPWLVVCFAESYALDHQGQRIKNYYVSESVGIACGLFIAAVHFMGLVTLPHTPSPMGFLGELLKRPSSERPFVLFPVGFPAADATVPDLKRKPLSDVAEWRPAADSAEQELRDEGYTRS